MADLLKSKITPDCSILLAEDSRDTLKMLRQLSIYLHCQIHLVENGQQAIDAYNHAKASGTPFSAIILDAAMPQVDGFQVAEYIRCGCGDKDTPIAFFTAFDDPFAVGRAYPLDAPIWFKPMAISDLAANIKNLLIGGGAKERRTGERRRHAR